MSSFGGIRSFAMKFNIRYFSPDLERVESGMGETSVTLFAKNSNQALHAFRDMYPDWDYKVRDIKEVPMCTYHDNVMLRGVESQKSNYAMDPANPRFDHFFAFDGVVYRSHPSIWYQVVETRFIWNGRFDNLA
jgi:hypothetical protein